MASAMVDVVIRVRRSLEKLWRRVMHWQGLGVADSRIAHPLHHPPVDSQY